MKLAKTIADYQVKIGNTSDAVAAQVEQLGAPETRCVVAGQQVGFAGGPFLTVLKAITCVQEATRLGAIPVFWAHTEDHDVQEVASATWLGVGGDLHRTKVRLPEGYFVEDLPWLAEHNEKLATFMEVVGVSSDIWQSATEGAHRYAEVMIRLLVQIMDGSGLLFIEPRLLRPFAGPFFSQELGQAAWWRQILQKDADGILKIDNDQTNLFYKDDAGKRVKIRECRDGFITGEKHWTMADLLRQPPERFSTGVAARPLLQDTILPTVAVIAGPNEAQYLTKLRGYYGARGVRMPQIVQRKHHTFVPNEARGWLEQLELKADELSLAPEGIKAQRERALATGLAPRRLHYLRNLLRPYGKPQERVFTWWQFLNDRGSYRVMQ